MGNVLCIVPEGRRKEEKGYPYEVSHIPFLEDILKYSHRHQYSLLYMYDFCGICYSDDIIHPSEIRLYKLGRDNLKKWSIVVCEQIVRLCIDFSCSKVYFMGTKISHYQYLFKLLERRGVEVRSPLVGKPKNIIENILSL